jgi:hypothetical protein
MKLELAKREDAAAYGAAATAKMAAGYTLSPEEMRGTLLKVTAPRGEAEEPVLFIPSRRILFLGPLVPAPGTDDLELTVALNRMIKDIRKFFDGDICYLNYEENGVDQAARRIGGFEEVPGVMVETERGKAKLMIQRAK